MSRVTVTAAGETAAADYTTPPVKPSSATVGARKYPETRYTGPSALTVAGTVIENMLIDQLLVVQAPRVRLLNCWIVGAAASRITSLVDCRSAACVDFVAERCTFWPTLPSSYLNGAILGHHYSAYACDVLGVVDGFGIYNTYGPDANVTIEDNWIHDLSYFAPDVASSRPETHNDGIQVQSGRGVAIRRNRIDCFMSATVGQQGYAQRARGNGILVQTNVPSSPATEWIIEDNWLAGGGNAGQVTIRSGKGILRGNQFTRDGYNFGGGPPPSRYQIRTDAALVPGIFGIDENYWEDGSGKLTAGRNTGIRLD